MNQFELVDELDRLIETLQDVRNRVDATACGIDDSCDVEMVMKLMGVFDGIVDCFKATTRE